MNLNNYRPTPPLQMVGTIEDYRVNHHPADGGSGYYSADASTDPAQAAVVAARNALATLTAQLAQSTTDLGVRSSTYNAAMQQLDYYRTKATQCDAARNQYTLNDKKEKACSTSDRNYYLKMWNDNAAAAKSELDLKNGITATIATLKGQITVATANLSTAIAAATDAVHSGTTYQTQEQKNLAAAALEKMKSDAQKATDKAKIDADAAVAKSRIDAQSAKDAGRSKIIMITIGIAGVLTVAFVIYRIVTRKKVVQQYNQLN